MILIMRMSLIHFTVSDCSSPPDPEPAVDTQPIIRSTNLARTEHAIFTYSSLWDTNVNPITNLYDGIK